MNSDPNDELEQRIRELFDASIEPAQGSTLTRLAARSAGIPRSKAGRSPRLGRWIWAAALLGGAAVLLLAGVWFSNGREPSAPPAGVPNTKRAGLVGDLRPMGGRAARHTAAPPRAEFEDDQGALLAELDSPWDATDIDADSFLPTPSEDADLDAWLYATHELLERK